MNGAASPANWARKMPGPLIVFMCKPRPSRRSQKSAQLAVHSALMPAFRGEVAPRATRTRRASHVHSTGRGVVDDSHSWGPPADPEIRRRRRRQYPPRRHAHRRRPYRASARPRLPPIRRRWTLEAAIAASLGRRRPSSLDQSIGAQQQNRARYHGQSRHRAVRFRQVVHPARAEDAEVLGRQAHGTAGWHQDRGARGHRSRAVRGDAAFRDGRGRVAHRPPRVGGQRHKGLRQAPSAAQPGAPSGRGGPQEPARRRSDQATDRERRRGRRGLSAGSSRTSGPRPRGLPALQSQAGLRPHDRLGPGRPSRRRPRSRHQLHRLDRRAACHRPEGGPPVRR